MCCGPAVNEAPRDAIHQLFIYSFIHSFVPTYVGELDHTQLAEIGKTIMSGVFVHNQGDILHRLGTKPFCHLESGIAAAAEAGEKPKLSVRSTATTYYCCCSFTVSVQRDGATLRSERGEARRRPPAGRGSVFATKKPTMKLTLPLTH